MPQAIIERPTEWKAHFGGKTLSRISLHTRKQTEAMQEGQLAHASFERSVSAALGCAAAIHDAADNSTRQVTPARLAKISAEARERVVRPCRLRTPRSMRACPTELTRA